MITNKQLGITEEDVMLEQDIETLADWRADLDTQIASILAHNSVNSWRELPPKAKSAYTYVVALQKIVKKRIGDISEVMKIETGYRSERQKRKDRHLAGVFMEVAKKELPKDDYARLLTLAQEKLQSQE